ncbi:hypothetical protein [Salmonirosea aquatica]|uniref:Uncharacterized protein n=1 Tax=Salmonirosea aquatica TaxID=2654236 RepID=A0A7C9FQJ5_9BACT|nr:hypothetical protein [Cytophagaceae bacterium SJW1-29]MPR37185.1 hypothetical protein [Cytophagaceae bacterium SJW1-29]
MEKPSAQIVPFPFSVRDDDTPIHDMSEPEVIWVARKEAAWLLNQLALGRISEIPESSRQCILNINEYCLKYGYPPIDCDL